MPINPGLVAAYRMTRARLARKGFANTPAIALERARADLERAGHDRFTYYPSAGDIGAPSERGARWVERPDANGLRFVGWCDDLARISHRGWYLDSIDQSDVARGCVYQLPARDGRAVYVEALRTGSANRAGQWSDMSGDTEGALMFFRDIHRGERGGSEYNDESAIRDAAHRADREAQIYAEAECEYRATAELGRQAAEAVTEGDAARSEARKLLAEMRGLRMADKPALCSAIRGIVIRHLAQAREDYDKARRLWRENGDSDAFQDAAGAASYWESRK